MTRILRYTAMTILIGVSTSCSMRKLIFKNADWVAMYQLDKYFDLTGDQERQFKTAIQGHIHWLRVEKNPEIQQFLEDAKKSWQTGPTPEDLNRLTRTYDDFRIQLVERIAPDAGSLLSQLSDRQLAHLEKKFLQSNKEIDEQLELSAEDFAKKQRKKLLKNIDFWIDGDLTSEQQNAYFAAVPPDIEVMRGHVVGRKASQQNLLQLLRKRPSSTEIASQLIEWAKSPHLMRSEATETKRMSRVYAQILTAHRVFTSSQRANVVARINELQRDITPE